jgi:hypothetical protein
MYRFINRNKNILRNVEKTKGKIRLRGVNMDLMKPINISSDKLAPQNILLLWKWESFGLPM